MLTLANIFLDFSAILVQLEGEQRLVEKIQTQNEAERAAGRRKAEQARDSALRELDQQFAGRSGADTVERNLAKERVQNEYTEAVRDVEKDSLRQIEIELSLFKERVQRMKKLQRRKTPSGNKENKAGTSADSYSRARGALEDKKKQIQDKMTDDIEALKT